MDILEFLDTLPPFKDEEILKSFVKGFHIINNRGYNSILCSISGGSDSDIMLDIIHRIDIDKKVKYVWFDTGLEYAATKEHLDYLEKKYNIKIIREKALKPIPLTCRQKGQPFLNKHVSDMIYRLQKHNFKWEDKPIEELLKKYPNCKSALQWWCNANTVLNIDRNKYLKEFITQNPPNFKISSKCCDFAKKNVSKKIVKIYDIDLIILGLRKSEGGLRSIKFDSCFSAKDNEVDNYRPIFWFKDETKEHYEKAFNILHSDCYIKYGFIRTGCACCPYARNLEDELERTRVFEPMLYKAVCNVFKDSYEYTRKYREFVAMMKLKEDKTQLAGQMDISDFLGV